VLQTTAAAHTPDEQVSPLGHAVPQAPQLEESVDRTTHVPLQLV
jgi:hypothetical protein